MDPRHRTPSPTMEAYLRLNRQPFGESTQYMPLKSATYAWKEPVRSRSDSFLPEWHGLPSPSTPGSFNNVDHVGSHSMNTNWSNIVASEDLGHYSQPMKSGFEERSLSREANSVQTTENSQNELQMEALSSESLEAPPNNLESITRASSPLSSLQSIEIGSPLFDSSFTTSNEQASLVGQDAKVVEQDTEYARALDATLDLVPLRRSSRIKKTMQDKDVPQSVLKPTKCTADACPGSAALEQFESSVTPFKPDPIHFSGLPKLHSVDWSLQYPPGGSTHASYPYPGLDPRLVFHEGFIPLSDGLPDISRLPKLFLPLGWKHVTWSGLLPIAFDPYRQAFKLTPAGPLPLTCEEVQQNGLYKYVPGGERHPETSHLPKMMELSDGSDGTVYNWEGVDWTLPWTEMNESLDFYKTAPGLPATDEADGRFLGHGQSISVSKTNAHYIEQWDCPDGIVDLSEAWRWLREKNLKPTAVFTPTAGKTWKGTGIQRASRKVKQPIASLMALTIGDNMENPKQYLVNQDRRDFCQFRSVATPVHIDVTLLDDIEITLMELLCYFPNHLYWRKGADRLCYAGLTGGDIANMINMTRYLSDDAARRGATVSHQLRYETSEDGIRVKIERLGENEVAYTAQGWTYTAWELTDYPLLALPHGLLSLPEGEDAGSLTKLILWCQAQGRYEVLLSHVPALIVEAGLEKKLERVPDDSLDKRMLAKHMEALKEDRKRVLESEKRKKRMAEAKEGQGKKQRTE